MIEPIKITVETDAQDVARKLNELIAAYNEHTHEITGKYAINDGGVAIPVRTSKPVDADPQAQGESK